MGGKAAVQHGIGVGWDPGVAVQFHRACMLQSSNSQNLNINAAEQHTKPVVQVVFLLQCNIHGRESCCAAWDWSGLGSWSCCAIPESMLAAEQQSTKP